MKHSFDFFENITSPDKLIYHTDLDEIPDYRSLGRALVELERGECNAGMCLIFLMSLFFVILLLIYVPLCMPFSDRILAR